VLKVFKEFLIEQYLMNKSVIIIVDEAQHLPDDTMEELRLLSNLETNKEKLLQIILIGQPELEARLAGDALRQLDQRITERIRLRPLLKSELPSYINHRLAMAGQKTLRLDNHAVNAVYGFSRGVPRIMNLLLSRSVMAAYVDGSASITPKHVRYAVTYLSRRRRKALPSRKQAYALSCTALAVLLAGIFSYALRTPGQHIPPIPQAAVALPASSPATTAPAAAEPAAAPLPAVPVAVETVLPAPSSTDNASKTAHLIITADAANVRTAPRLDAPKVGLVFYGMKVDALDLRKDSGNTTWYKIFSSPSSEGWISEQVVTIDENR